MSSEHCPSSQVPACPETLPRLPEESGVWTLWAGQERHLLFLKDTGHSQKQGRSGPSTPCSSAPWGWRVYASTCTQHTVHPHPAPPPWLPVHQATSQHLRSPFCITAPAGMPPSGHPPGTPWGLWGAFLTPIRQGWSHPAWHLRQAPSGCSHAVFRLCCLPGSGSTSASPMSSNRRTEAELPVRHCSLRCTLKYPQFKSGKQGTEMF